MVDSYPRTESTSYPGSFDFRNALGAQLNNPVWGDFVQSLLAEGSVPSARRNVRDATRGKGIERLVTQLGHAISVPIPSLSGAPEGEHATSLANEIGKEIRSSALVRNCGWDNIDAGSREAIIMRVRNR
ncbi:uncharacterized protein A4U43_C09F6730 [Asparagus officinalis]|uniref:Uncharacterized protein n=1 Tax=Asparagus officinalis TaxID=4686 RepID=A0A5P1E7L0_ASPOF|nr:uncharacterized protein A4U43_C09F6730 [Asparagus officinalis]